MDTILYFSESVVANTLRFLQASGEQEHEGIVLWLGVRAGSTIQIKNVYQPAHRAEADMFHIPSASMLQLKEYLRKNRLFVAAQVHSHPLEAFHSSADDKWAIVRHVGALSIVIPYFARQTTPATFFENIAVFRLSQSNEWELVPKHKVMELCKLVD